MCSLNDEKQESGHDACNIRPHLTTVGDFLLSTSGSAGTFCVTSIGFHAGYRRAYQDCRQGPRALGPSEQHHEGIEFFGRNLFRTMKLLA